MRKLMSGKRLFLIAAIVLACCRLAAHEVAADGTAAGQQLAVAGTVTGNMPQDMTLFLMPVTDAGQAYDTIRVDGGRLGASVRKSPWNIYRVIGVTAATQTIIPVAIEPKEGKATLELAWSDGRLVVAATDDDNVALNDFNEGYAKYAKQLWTEGKDMDNVALGQLVKAYLPMADSVMAGRKVTENVATFIRLWATVLTYDAATGLEFSTGRKLSDTGIDAKNLLGTLCDGIDCDMSAAFQQTAHMAVATLPAGSLEQRMEALHASFHNEGLCRRATDMMVSQYIASFPYATNYEEGLAELAAITSKYSLQKKHLNDFKVRKASAVGNLFPEDVELCEVNGKKVDFANFRGKYVYIDMWASWCVPCIKEIPHLKKLEEELRNKDVVFLSVSIDRSEDAWKKKVAELGLKGNQLIDHGGKLATAMNVKGIPFFIIYDRDGRLYKYNAYRPSDLRLKPLLDSLK